MIGGNKSTSKLPSKGIQASTQVHVSYFQSPSEISEVLACQLLSWLFVCFVCYFFCLIACFSVLFARLLLEESLSKINI